MISTFSTQIWLAAGVGVLAGFVIGYLVFYRRVRRDADRSAARIQSESDAYRQQVEQHFAKTAELFEGVTNEYRQLYQHLATGAQSLCDTSAAVPELRLTEGLVPQDETHTASPEPPSDVQTTTPSGAPPDQEPSESSPTDTPSEPEHRHSTNQ
ncbi:MAG: DUF1043 family protein [Gammaproteobacteria bacterium]|nr:DUF1043 family protein [Gammaproteobacteria bacterium]